jgi:hypothetical protein
LRVGIVFVLLAGCGVLDGPIDQAPIVTLHLQVVVPPDQNEQPPAALVWYAGAASVAVADDTERNSTVTGFDIDILALPPASTLTTVGSRRIALGQLVFYADLNEDGAPTLDSGDIIVGAPMNAQLLYLEGPAVDPSAADPAQLLVAGAQPGFNWLSVPAGAPCAPAASPLSTTIKFAFEQTGDLGAAATPPPSLCSATASVPACSATPGPTLATCE